MNSRMVNARKGTCIFIALFCVAHNLSSLNAESNEISRLKPRFLTAQMMRRVEGLEANHMFVMDGNTVQRHEMHVELPDPHAIYSAKDHTEYLIFWDKETNASVIDVNDPSPLIPNRKPAVLLRNLLEEHGIPIRRIRVVPINGAKGFISALAADNSPKHVFLFGHAAPGHILFGDSKLKLADLAALFYKSHVKSLVNYGCSFLRPESEQVAAFVAKMQARLKNGEEFRLYGHEFDSAVDGSQDSPLDSKNPIVALSITRQSSKRINYHQEFDDLLRALRKELEQRDEMGLLSLNNAL